MEVQSTQEVFTGILREVGVDYVPGSFTFLARLTMPPDSSHFERELSKIEDRLRSLELQQSKTSSHLEGEVSNLVRLMSEIRDIIKRHDTMFFGTNGNAGLITRLDRLEQSEKTRQWTSRAAIGTSIALIIKIVWDLIMTHGVAR